MRNLKNERNTTISIRKQLEGVSGHSLFLGNLPRPFLLKFRNGAPSVPGTTSANDLVRSPSPAAPVGPHDAASTAGACLWEELAIVHVLVGSAHPCGGGRSVAERQLARGLQARPSTHVSPLPSQTFRAITCWSIASPATKRGGPEGFTGPGDTSAVRPLSRRHHPVPSAVPPTGLLGPAGPCRASNPGAPGSESRSVSHPSR